MRGTEPLIVLALVLLCAACVQQADFARYQNEVQRGLDRNEAAIEILRKDISILQSKVMKEIEGLRSNMEEGKVSSDRREEEFVKRLADLGADLDAVKREVAALHGSLEERRHFSEKAAREVETLRKGFASQLSDLEGKVAELEKGLIALKKVIPERPPSPTPPTTAPSAADSQRPPEVEEGKLYAEAKARFDDGEYDEAREDFRRFLKAYPKSKYADNAQYWLGECYYRKGAYEQAIVEYEKVITGYPKGEKVSSAILKQAMAFDKLGDRESARFLFQKVVKEFPHTPQASRAATELARMK